MTTKKKQIITIAGFPGSGKSTTAKGIAKQLSYDHFSSGDLFRAISKEQGKNVLESNLAAEKEEGIPLIDQLVDQRLRDIGEKDNTLIIDSRMAWHWMPYSFKVFLSLDLGIAAQRILKQMTPERIEAEHVSSDPAEYEQSLRHRLESESRRYNKIYNVDPYELENYDLVIDTALHGPDSVVQQILDAYQAWSNS